MRGRYLTIEDRVKRVDRIEQEMSDKVGKGCPSKDGLTNTAPCVATCERCWEIAIEKERAEIKRRKG